MAALFPGIGFGKKISFPERFGKKFSSTSGSTVYRKYFFPKIEVC
jgi:hypothetical protein